MKTSQDAKFLEAYTALRYIRRRTTQGLLTTIEELASYFGVYKESARLAVDQLIARDVVDFKILDRRRQINGFFACETYDWSLEDGAGSDADDFRGTTPTSTPNGKGGRLAKKLPPNFPDVFAQYVRREISSSQAAKLTGVSPPTFRKQAAAYRKMSQSEISPTN